MPPIHYEHSSYYSSQRGCGCLIPMLYILGLILYPKTAMAHTYVTDYNNFFWGLLQGLYLWWTLILRAIDSKLALYQEGAGTMYGFGYVVGIGLVVWYIFFRD